MNKMLKIIKVSLNALYFSSFKRASQKKKFNYFTVVMPILGVYMAGYFSFIAYSSAKALEPLGMLWFLVLAMNLICFAFTLFTGLYSINGLLFSGKDLEQLLSYPVKHWKLLFCRLISVVAENWVISFFVAAPVLTVYSIYKNPPAMFYISAVIGYFLSPLLPVTVAFVISYLINLLSVGTRFKTAFNVILTIAFIFGITLLPQYLVKNFNTIVETSGSFMSAVTIIIPTAGFLTKAACENSLLDLFYFCLAAVVPFFVMMLVLSKWYFILWSKNQGGRKTAAKEIKAQSGGKLSALYKKEISRFFSSYSYLLNTGIGMVLLTILTVVSLFSGDELIKSLLELPSSGDFLLPGITLAYCFMTGLCCTTAPSVSLEGQSLWILKAAPVSVQDIFKAKLYLNFTVVFPLLLINSAVMAVALKLHLAGFLILLLLPGVFSVFSAAIGLISNIHLPRLNLKNDMQIVKQSPSVLVSLCSTFLMLGIFSGLYYLLADYISFEIFVSITFAVLAVMAAAAYRYLFTKCVRLFEELS